MILSAVSRSVTSTGNDNLFYSLFLRSVRSPPFSRLPLSGELCVCRRQMKCALWSRCKRISDRFYQKNMRSFHADILEDIADLKHDHDEWQFTMGVFRSSVDLRSFSMALAIYWRCCLVHGNIFMRRYSTKNCLKTGHRSMISFPKRSDTISELLSMSNRSREINCFYGLATFGLVSP